MEGGEVGLPGCIFHLKPYWKKKICKMLQLNNNLKRKHTDIAVWFGSD